LLIFWGFGLRSLSLPLSHKDIVPLFLSLSYTFTFYWDALIHLETIFAWVLKSWVFFFFPISIFLYRVSLPRTIYQIAVLAPPFQGFFIKFPYMALPVSFLFSSLAFRASQSEDSYF
jgi:hypothetical protein